MGAAAELARLNEVDLIVDGLKARLAEIAEALKEPADVRAARIALAEGDAELARLRASQRDCELKQQSAADKLARDEKALYGGTVHNSKELANLEAEMRQSRRLQSECEDMLLEILIAVEAAEARQQAARQTLAQLSSEWETTQASLRDEQARLRKRLATEQARQSAARAAAPALYLPTYDALRARKNGRAVATIDGDVCSACRVAVSPTKLVAVRDDDALVYCENCGRLLFGE